MKVQTMIEDAELLRRYVTDRSEEAFAELVWRHVDLVYSVALRQVGGDVHLARDVAQTVFTALARKARSLTQRGVIGGWLYRSTQFAASDAVRAERRRRAREQEARTMHEIISAPAPVPDWEKLRPILDEAIGELGATDRDAVWLRYFENRSFADIGQRLRLTENAARMRVERALDKLHALLARRGIASTTTALALALPGQSGIAAPAGLAAALTQSALGSAGIAMSGATAGWTLFQIMSTTKITVGLAAVITIAAVGTTLYKARELREARATLVVARDENATMQNRIADLEQRVEEITSFAVSEPAVPVPASTPVRPVDEPLTEDSVRERHKHAQELARNGQYEEALAELLWCYDVGMPGFAPFGGLRMGVLAEIADLGSHLPSATNVLRERRDAAEHQLRTAPYDFRTATALTGLNRVLHEENRSVQFHDQLPVDDPRREKLGRLLYDEFAGARRYQDAARARPYNQMSSHFEMFINRMPQGTASGQAADTRDRDMAIRSAATSIEVLAAVGDLEHAAELAVRVLAYDSSPATIALLEEHTARAGYPRMISDVHPR